MVLLVLHDRPAGLSVYKTFFVLNSTEYEIYPANKFEHLLAG